MELAELPELLSLGRVRELTGLSKDSIRRLRQAGILRAWQFPGGKRHLYPKSDVARILSMRYPDPDSSPKVPPEPAPDRSHAAA